MILQFLSQHILCNFLANAGNELLWLLGADVKYKVQLKNGVFEYI